MFALLGILRPSRSFWVGFHLFKYFSIALISMFATLFHFLFWWFRWSNPPVFFTRLKDKFLVRIALVMSLLSHGTIDFIDSFAVGIYVLVHYCREFFVPGCPHLVYITLQHFFPVDIVKEINGSVKIGMLVSPDHSLRLIAGLGCTTTMRYT